MGTVKETGTETERETETGTETEAPSVSATRTRMPSCQRSQACTLALSLPLALSFAVLQAGTQAEIQGYTWFQA